jgi:hypothetical protein
VTNWKNRINFKSNLKPERLHRDCQCGSPGPTCIQVELRLGKKQILVVGDTGCSLRLRIIAESTESVIGAHTQPE